MFNGICEALHRELLELDEKLAKGVKMNVAELEQIDKMSHALKSLAAYEAMSGASEYSGDSYRGRSRMSGRYSREGGRQVEYGKDYDSYYGRY